VLEHKKNATTVVISSVLRVVRSIVVHGLAKCAFAWVPEPKIPLRRDESFTHYRYGGAVWEERGGEGGTWCAVGTGHPVRTMGPGTM